VLVGRGAELGIQINGKPSTQRSNPFDLPQILPSDTRIVMASQQKMKLAVLTSGGDSAGMNAVVRAVVKGGILKCAYRTASTTLLLNIP